MDINNTPLKVFDESVVQLLADISADLLKSPLVRQYPDLAAFAFYVRKANLLKLRDTLFPSTTTTNDYNSRLGRGLCFHIAPGNIPVNFAFSWVFSLLAGNANVVRLPTKQFPQVDALIKIINSHLAQHSSLLARNLFVQYPRTDTEQTAAYCKMADCRMIWGGDRTIASIKALPASPRCVDIAFADRYSFAIVDGAAILAADEAAMKRLAESFYNDTWLMDQNACSSPQVICWTNDSPEARNKFWAAAESVAKAKYALQDAIAVDKLTLLCEEAVTNPACEFVARSGNLLYREELASLDADLVNHRGKAGYFFEHSLASCEEIVSVVTEKYQTITYFGIDPLALREQLIAAHIRGIDRIVPIGQAMDIGAIWDGHDLIRELSRIISVG